MPAPKKAAKKAAKHEADPKEPKPKNKHDKHGDDEPKHKTLKDLRRTYEHLGRVECLMTQLTAAAKADVATLIALAQSQLNEGHAKTAAELVRASEHLAFASLVKIEGRKSDLASAVKQAMEEEFEHLSHKAGKRWKESDDRHREVGVIYERALEEAGQALGKGAYRRAMEMVRAADSLAHVEKHGPEKLASGKARRSLTA